MAKRGWRIQIMIMPMIDDKRPIKQIFKEYGSYDVGTNGITKIEIYQEPGQMGYVNYAALFQGDSICMRIDLSGWGVVYEE